MIQYHTKWFSCKVVYFFFFRTRRTDGRNSKTDAFKYLLLFYRTPRESHNIPSRKYQSVTFTLELGGGKEGMCSLPPFLSLSFRSLVRTPHTCTSGVSFFLNSIVRLLLRSLILPYWITTFVVDMYYPEILSPNSLHKSRLSQQLITYLKRKKV